MTDEEKHNQQSKRHPVFFNDVQLGMVFDILKNSAVDVYQFIPTTSKGNANDKTKKECVYGLNKANFQMGMLFTRYYDLDETPYMDPKHHLYKYMNSNRTHLLVNKYRALISADFFNNPALTDETIKSFEKVISRFANGIFSCPAKSFADIRRINEFGWYNSMLIYINSRHHCSKYLHPPVSCTYRNCRMKDYYKIVQVPKDLQMKFNKISKFFNEIKGELTLNQSNGFYSYVFENVKIPVICRHEYLTLEGVPPAEISIECYKGGKCKYCGQEITPYHEQIKDSLPPRVYDLIYKYIATINENIEVDGLMYALFNLLFDAIQANIKVSNVKNYDASVIAFASLFLYKVYTITKGKINYNNKLGKFLDSVKEYGSAVGWSQEKMDLALNNKQMFGNIENITNIIKEKIYTNEIKYLESLPLSVLFDHNVDPRDKAKLKATSKLQQLYLEGTEKMLKFNDLIDKAHSALWKLSHANELISKSKTLAITSSLPEVKSISIKNGEQFFDRMCKNYCPVNEIHEYSGDTCKHCGLKKDASNKKAIYDKYQNLINNQYLQKPNVIEPARFNIDKAYSIAEIEKYKGDDLFDKYILIENHLLKQELDQAITKGEHLDEVMKLISLLTTIDKENLKTDPAFIRKAFAFIIDQHIKSSDELLNELEFIYLKINDIQLLLL